jgi:asparagine synthase (glutamine-hydrolysing)
LIGYFYDTDQLLRLADANGQFAAAIYDRSRHHLVLITDRIATTAIHVWQQGQEIAFASHLYTLLGDRRIVRKPDRAAVAQLFTMQRTIGETTPIKGVVALPAACIATFDRRGGTRRHYWELGWRRAKFDDAEGGTMLAAAIRRAVARQSIGRNNGLLLSGGVDSRMVLAAARDRSLTCWTTASYEANPELMLAKRVARMFGAEHHALIVDPSDTLSVHDDTVVESGGLYPASNPMSAFLPKVGERCDVVLTGHGLDYTLRGYYLPTRFVKLAGSRTRLPILQPRPARPTGRDVLNSLRQGPPRATIERIVRAGRVADWWNGLEELMQAVLHPWLDSEEPYNAWDAFILHAVNKHYAFTGMMSARAVVDLAIPAFDNEVLSVYLGMTPQARVSGRVVHKAIRMLAPEAAALPNANTGFRADLNPWLEVGALVLRGGLRRMGLVKRTSLPSPLHSAGSWQNIDLLYRLDAGYRRRLLDIRGRLDALTCGTLSVDGLAECIDEHLDGRARHAKLLRQLLTHDAWVSRFGIETRH